VERVGFREREHARLVPTIGARLDVQAPYGSQTRPRLSEASGSLESAFLLWSRERVLGVVVVYLLVRNLFALVRLLPQPRRSKELEILVLRHELAILRRQAARPALTRADRALLASLSPSLPRTVWSCFPVRSETLLCWHR
jgi:hypothetical protein